MGIEPATFRLVEEYPNQLHHCIPQNYNIMILKLHNS